MADLAPRREKEDPVERGFRKLRAVGVEALTPDVEVHNRAPSGR